MAKYYLFGGGHFGEFVTYHDRHLAVVTARPRVDIGDRVDRAIDEELTFLVHEHVIDGTVHLVGVYGHDFPDDDQIERAIILNAGFNR